MRKTASKAPRPAAADEATVTCRLLTALGQDVRIVVQPKPRSRSRATLRATVGAD